MCVVYTVYYTSAYALRTLTWNAHTWRSFKSAGLSEPQCYLLISGLQIINNSLVPDNKEEPMAEDGGSSAARLDGWQ